MKNIFYPRYFAGATTPSGFDSRFSELYDTEKGELCYILKGGPGTGKSTLMKRLCAEGSTSGDSPEVFLCSSDPDSLDAVRFPRSGTVIADGTAPHVMEPTAPGISEQLVNLGEYFDLGILASERENILSLMRENALLHARARRYVTAAGTLLDDIFTLRSAATDTAKASLFGDGLAARLLHPENKKGRAVTRYLTAVTPKGVLFLADTVTHICPDAVIIDDPCGAASSVLLEAVAKRALSLGCDVILCPSPFSSKFKLEQVIVPSQRKAFTVSDRYRKITSERRTLHAARFTKERELIPHRSRIDFDRKTAARLLSTASDILSQANAVHRELEKYYIAAMDFSKNEKFFEAMRKRIILSPERG